MAGTNDQPLNTALITGGSRGIGYELATLCAQDGYDLMLVARQRRRLERAADELESRWSTTVRTVAMDLSRPEAAAAIGKEIDRADLQVDMLVNNAAARPTADRFDEQASDERSALLQTNIHTLTELTGRVVGPMVDRGFGRILNVSSAAGEIPNPTFGVYAATKAYVSTFSTVLAHQLEPVGITVSVLIPGWTETDMAERVFKDLAIDPESKETLPPEDVARAGYNGLLNGQTRVIPGRHYREAIRTALSTRAATIDE